MCNIYKNLNLEDIKGEIWEDIEDFPHYQVSNMGRIKRLKYKGKVKRINKKGEEVRQTYNEKILTQSIDTYGYLQVRLTKINKNKRTTIKVHKLVAKVFVSNPKNKPQVNHINEDKTDNRVENLEWATAAENNRHGTRNERAGVSISQAWKNQKIYQYDKNNHLIAIYNSIQEAKRDGYDHNEISLCLNGKSKTHKGYIWKRKGEDKNESRG